VALSIPAAKKASGLVQLTLRTFSGFNSRWFGLSLGFNSRWFGLSLPGDFNDDNFTWIVPFLDNPSRGIN
jgi:hypothetical protein